MAASRPRIVVDKNIPFAAEALRGLGDVTALPGSAPVAALGLSLPFAALPVVGAVWSIPADPKLIVGALVVTGAVCAWQVR